MSSETLFHREVFAGRRMQGVGPALGCSRRKGAVGDHWGPFPSPYSCMFTVRCFSKRLGEGLQHPQSPGRPSRPPLGGAPGPLHSAPLHARPGHPTVGRCVKGSKALGP